uniref:Uncharacterized protein n=1 Tax=Rhizophora mucronata TaxID=61149 RepID=A0A2P2NQN9_RHIMU
MSNNRAMFSCFLL